MKGQQSPKWVLSLLVVSCIAAGQDTALIPVNVPDSLDPNQGSEKPQSPVSFMT